MIRKVGIVAKRQLTNCLAFTAPPDACGAMEGLVVPPLPPIMSVRSVLPPRLVISATVMQTGLGLIDECRNSASVRELKEIAPE